MSRMIRYRRWRLQTMQTQPHLGFRRKCAEEPERRFQNLPKDMGTPHVGSIFLPKAPLRLQGPSPSSPHSHFQLRLQNQTSQKGRSSATHWGPSIRPGPLGSVGPTFFSRATSVLFPWVVLSVPPPNKIPSPDSGREKFSQFPWPRTEAPFLQK